MQVCAALKIASKFRTALKLGVYLTYDTTTVSEKSSWEKYAWPPIQRDCSGVGGGVKKTS